ncbi:type I pullulanase [bacterium]|nr:type I pullulanase [bacterium]
MNRKGLIGFGAQPTLIIIAAILMTTMLQDQTLRAEPVVSDSGETLTIHYHRYDGDYTRASLWTWDGLGEQEPESPEVMSSGRDDFGVVFKVDTSQYGVTGTDDDRIGFIPRLYQSWDHKDGSDRYWTEDMGYEIWLIGNDRRIYSEKPDISPKIASAFIDAADKMALVFSHPLNVKQVDPKNFSVEVDGEEIAAVKARPVQPSAGQTFMVAFTLEKPIDITAEEVTAKAIGYRSSVAVPRKILMNAEYYYSDEPMGAVYSPDATTFRLFSPTAQGAWVVLYDERAGDAGRKEVPMESAGKGVWEATVAGDLAGRFYMVQVDTKRFGKSPEVYDPSATNTTDLLGRGRITDLRKTDPEGFRPVKRPVYGDSPTDAIIYEMHVRDFTIAADSGVEAKGKYTGFVEAGTHMPGNPEIKTAIDHLKELGVTHVQLMPPQDFDNDESDPVYNWGYMTCFFNSPDGWFASDYKNESKIREFKQMVQALHAADIRVIMDVVYNHTAPPSTFEQIAPGYYHRMKPDGSFWNGSGTGNEFRSEAPMARKYLLDSCKYWVEEFGVDGFRFDLMGLIDLETLQELRKEMDKIDPTILIYGEPWAGGTPGLSRLTDKGVVSGTGLAAFNDHIRDAIKGSTEGTDGGYVQNGGRRDGVKHGIAGSISDWATNPTDSINYVTCHDNLTLWDKLKHSSPSASVEDLKQMQKLAFGILGVSQGTLFFHGGCEMLRTKDGVHNSYNSPDEINEIDWVWKKDNQDVVEYFKGIITLRKAHPIFRLKTAHEVRDRLSFTESALPVPTAIAFTLDGKGLEGEEWQKVAVFINPDARPQTFNVPSMDHGYVYALGDKVGTKPLGSVNGSIEVPGRSLAIVASSK